MAVKWTEEQKKVITLRDRNILVSAAAGSGKTAVLVQRILSKIMDPLKPVDIDRLLIMTFTRAAAGEMRERIERGLDQALAEDPDNEHLQRQMTLIHTAQITTIDGFCAYVIRNYFHLIGLDPGYRTADEGELKLLQEDVLKELFEDHYVERKADFTAFVECYAPGKTDEGLKEHVLELYNAAMSNPWPEKWLDSCVENYHLDPEKGLEGTQWFRYLWEAADCALKEAEELTETAMKTCQLQDGPELYLEALEKDMILIRQLKQLSVKKDYDEIVAGERRWRAAKLAGLKEVPVVVRELSTQEIVEISLIENIQREDLNPVEEAMAYKRLIDEFHMKQDEIAERVSKSRTAVTNSMRLLKLDSRVQQMMVDEMISAGHARAILAIDDPEKQYTTAMKVFDEKLSVRETEKLVKAVLTPTKKKDKVTNPAEDAIYESLEERMKGITGTRVFIHRKKNNKGKIEIEYYSRDDLDRIIDLFESIG